VWACVLAIAGFTSSAEAQDAGVAPAAQGSTAPVSAVAATDEVATPEAVATPVEAAEAEATPTTVAAPQTAAAPMVTSAAPAASAASAAAPASAGIPLRFELHGYYRARLVWTHDVPVADGETTPAPSEMAAYAFMRLRLDPAITYGTDPLNPIAAARFQIDALDNVVFGDNARIQSTPLFGETPSMTDIDGFDVQPFRLRRAWLEFLLPIGQLRIGRQGSQGGMGILFNDGNGFRNDWGDAQYGTTFDRVLFATRPLTIFNALTKGDARPTPLILAVGHDWLVEDPIGYETGAPYVPVDPTGGTTALPAPGTLARSTLPFQNFLNGNDDVGQSILVLAWNDPKINPLRTTDELQIGAIGVYRYQNNTSSDIFIPDLFVKSRLSPFGNRAPQLVFNGELQTIQGSSQGLAIGQDFIEENGVSTGRTANTVDANVWGAVVQAGLAMDKKWQGMIEWGYSTGDANLFFRSDRRFDQRPLHPDYHVGLLLYQVALAVQTADTLPSRALWSRGGVWNSMYWFPQFRYQLINGVEAVGAFLLAWADTLNEAFPAAAAKREAARPGDPNATVCSPFDPDCFLGWELDLALKVSWGENDILRWSTEFGIMNAGGPLAPELQNDMLWTLQTRIAMVF
jgi:hypothetical protein